MRRAYRLVRGLLEVGEQALEVAAGLCQGLVKFQQLVGRDQRQLPAGPGVQLELKLKHGAAVLRIHESNTSLKLIAGLSLV